MDLSDEQNQCRLDFLDWYEDPVRRRRPYELAGLAGTGKTTIAMHLAAEVKGNVVSGAYTGKAASVLRKKGLPNATTIHSLIYSPSGDSNHKERDALTELIEDEMKLIEPERSKLKLEAWRRQLEELEKRSRAMFELKGDDATIHDADLVIIDERSTVDERMQKDLESFRVPILFLGDPGQLPPVNGRMADFTPDFTLREIHRQAAESPIIRLAHDFRAGRFPAFGHYSDEVSILKKRDWDWAHVAAADQVLVGMNETRHKTNRGIRKHLGHMALYPEAGEKLICLKNNHDEGFLNGITATTTKASEKRKGPLVRLNMNWEGKFKEVLADAGFFEETYGERHGPRADRNSTEAFGYGYAITVHKAQGSQWNNVVVADDRMRANDFEHRKRWLYTAVTRAEEGLTIYA